MRRVVTSFLVMLTVVAASGCGTDPGSAVRTPDGSSGSAKLIVHNSRSAYSGKSYNSIKVYKVAVAGTGIEPPIEAEFGGDAESGVIDGIPSGTDRKITVQAVNQDDKTIREGEAGGVGVSPGQVAEVDVEMDAVPIFANLEDGNVVKSTRLRFDLFADPEDPLKVENVVGDESSAMFDLASSTDEFYPAVDTGVAVVVPQSVPVGQQTFRVSSKRTGKSSSVTIKIIDGAEVTGAPLYSASSMDVIGDYVGVARVGGVLYAPPASGVVWPRLLGQVLTEY